MKFGIAIQFVLLAATLRGLDFAGGQFSEQEELDRLDRAVFAMRIQAWPFVAVVFSRNVTWSPTLIVPLSLTVATTPPCPRMAL